VCYVCGRMYGLSSFEIHLKQCKELWIAREAQKPARERKPIPDDPFVRGENSPSFHARGSTSGQDMSHNELDAMNAAATAAYNTKALDTCVHCGRTFLPEKLVIHNRSCTAEKPARRVTDAVRRAPDPLIREPIDSFSSPVPPPNRPKSAHLPLTKSPGTNDETHSRPNSRTISPAHLAGPIGGPSGREIRKQNPVPVPVPQRSAKDTARSSTQKPPSSISSSDEDEPPNITPYRHPSSPAVKAPLSDTLLLLMRRVEAMEESSAILTRNIQEIKTLIIELQQQA
jgi:hypothetical protein